MRRIKFSRVTLEEPGKQNNREIKGELEGKRAEQNESMLESVEKDGQ